ncbi:MAG TPA: hypothetical protein VF075_14640 [Pyrinomonadaceae bacterium]
MKTLILVLLLVAPPQTLAQRSAARAKPRPLDMSSWAGKYPDAKFMNQPLISTPLRRILSKADYVSLRDYNLMTPIERVGDYLVTNAQIKYSIPNERLNIAFSLKDNSVYVVFWKGDDNPTHRKFSTKNNDFNLPDEVLKELGLKEE